MSICGFNVSNWKRSNSCALTWCFRLVEQSATSVARWFINKWLMLCIFPVVDSYRVQWLLRLKPKPIESYCHPALKNIMLLYLRVNYRIPSVKYFYSLSSSLLSKVMSTDAEPSGETSQTLVVWFQKKKLKFINGI